MGSIEKGRFVCRITAPWCGSRVAAGKTTVLTGVLSFLTSEASLVPVAWIWNAMVPRLEMATTLRKQVTNVMPVTAVLALTVSLKQVIQKASKTPEDSVTSIALVASMVSMVASMASMVASMASMASVTPTTLVPLASVALLVSRISLSDLSRRKLSNEMLRFSPMENWLGSLTKQTWVDGRSRSTRRVGVVKMKEELMGSLVRFVVMIQSEEGANGLSDMDWLVATIGGVDG